MPTYSIAAPNGNTYQIDGPEGASQQDVIAQVMKQHPDASTKPDTSLTHKAAGVAEDVASAGAKTVVGTVAGVAKVATDIGAALTNQPIDNPVHQAINSVEDKAMAAVSPGKAGQDLNKDIASNPYVKKLIDKYGAASAEVKEYLDAHPKAKELATYAGDVVSAIPATKGGQVVAGAVKDAAELGAATLKKAVNPNLIEKNLKAVGADLSEENKSAVATKLQTDHDKVMNNPNYASTPPTKAQLQANAVKDVKLEGTTTTQQSEVADKLLNKEASLTNRTSDQAKALESTYRDQAKTAETNVQRIGNSPDITPAQQKFIAKANFFTQDADGNVLRVNQKSFNKWINQGRADGLIKGTEDAERTVNGKPVYKSASEAQQALFSQQIKDLQHYVKLTRPGESNQFSHTGALKPVEKTDPIKAVGKAILDHKIGPTAIAGGIGHVVAGPVGAGVAAVATQGVIKGGKIISDTLAKKAASKAISLEERKRLMSMAQEYNQDSK